MIVSHDDNHVASVSIRGSGEFQVDCSCGAMWTHSASGKREDLQSIYDSHLRYFNKPKVETL